MYMLVWMDNVFAAIIVRWKIKEYRRNKKSTPTTTNLIGIAAVGNTITTTQLFIKTVHL